MSALSPRTLLLTTDAVGGVWTYSCGLARELATQGVRCTLAVLGPTPSGPALAEAADISWIETGLDLDWTAPDPSRLLQAARTLSVCAQDLGADSLHLHSPAFAQAPLPIPCVAVIHSCVATWWRALRTVPLPPDLAWRAQALATGAAFCDALIAPTQAFAADLHHCYPNLPPIQIVPNGIAAPPPPSLPREPFVLAAGRLWDDAKGMATLDDAAQRIAIPVLAAGPLQSPLHAGFKPRHIRPLGNLSAPDLRRRMAQAAIFAAPSRYEPFGLAVLEAASHATPLVLSDIPSFRELWQGAARFVPATDAAAWADALQDLAGDPEARRTLGAAAHERAQRFTLTTTAQRTLAIHIAAQQRHLRAKRAA